MFAATYLPPKLPRLGIAVEFATKGEFEHNYIMQRITLKALTPLPFLLQKQLITFIPSKHRPLELFLISQKQNCTLCGEKLSLRKDRPATVVVYDDNLGAVAGSLS